MNSNSNVNLRIDGNKKVEDGEPSPYPIILQNSTATISLKLDPNHNNGKINLVELALNCRNSEFNPKRFSACIMRLRGTTLFPNLRTTGLIFGNGKIVITGSKSESQAFYSAKQFAKIIKKLGYPILNENNLRDDFKIHNIVAMVSLNHLIRLDGLATDSEHKLFASYEPEIFAGLIYRMVRPKVVLLIFVSGKILFTGAKSVKDIEDALKIFIPFLESYKTLPSESQQQEKKVKPPRKRRGKK